MTKPLPKKSGVICQVPTQVTLLGEALKPGAINLHEALALKESAIGPEFDTLNDVRLHMGIIGQALMHLDPRLDDLMKSVIQNDRATALDAGRAAGRLEQVLSEFVNGYQMALASKPRHESREARDLLFGVYRHHISELSRWLDKLVMAIAEPLATLKEQHIQLEANVVLPVTLNLTSPPQMARLHEIALEFQSETAYQAPIQDQPTRPGPVATLGALAFGLGVANAVWGKKHD
jgi:hypothetical protein